MNANRPREHNEFVLLRVIFLRVGWHGLSYNYYIYFIYFILLYSLILLYIHYSLAVCIYWIILEVILWLL